MLEEFSPSQTEPPVLTKTPEVIKQEEISQAYNKQIKVETPISKNNPPTHFFKKEKISKTNNGQTQMVTNDPTIYFVKSTANKKKQN